MTDGKWGEIRTQTKKKKKIIKELNSEHAIEILTPAYV